MLFYKAKLHVIFRYVALAKTALLALLIFSL